MRKTVPHLIALGLLCAATAQASTHTFDFNTDPTGILSFYGSAAWFSSDGAGGSTNANDGFLQITPDSGSQSGAIVFDDFDSGEVVQGFTFEADLRIGNGTSSPADGFSLNYVRDSDPALADVAAGGAPSHWATGPNNEANLPEEGTQTGISVGFDAWASGGTPPYADELNQSIGPDIVAVDVRVDGILVLQAPMPTLNGAVDDATSIQTGPNDGSNSRTGLGWAHLKVDLNTNGVLNVWWKNFQILTNFQTSYAPSPGRLIFAGRTGGSWEVHDVDNITITTIAAATVSPGNVTATYPDGAALAFFDSGSGVVDTTKPPTFQIDGGSVQTGTLSKSGVTTTVFCHGFPTLLAPGSSHSISAVVTDTFGRSVTNSRNFTVPGYGTVNSSWAVTGVNTTQKGFRVKPWQSGIEPNDIWWADEQLAGLHGARNSLMDLSQATDNGYIDFTGVINLNYTNSAGVMNENGNFTANNGYEETQLPGIVTDPSGTTNVDNCALEILTFLKFPKAGVYQMGVNSDDGFDVTVGPNPADWGALSLGSFNGGRGASDTTFFFAVTNAGIYPVRLVWENGGGGANCEWFVVQDDGTKVLVNDPDPTNTTGVAAYYSGPVLPAFVSQLLPHPNTTLGDPGEFSASVTDLGTTVTSGSLSLYLDGVLKNATFSSAGGVTTAKGTDLLPAGQHTAQLVYSTSSGGPITNTWTFTVPPYTILDPSWAVTGVDTTKSGFRVRPWQSSGQPNNMRWTDEQLAGFHGANNADLSLATDNGYIDYTDVINWDNPNNHDGNFQAPNYPDIPFPGSNGANPWDNSAEEVLAYIYLPSIGTYCMGVNSDDGFKVTSGRNPSDWLAPILGQFNGGRGASDTLFFFYVSSPGYYPIRMTWENGGGGFNCEWFSVLPNGTKVLINDPNNPASLKAYYAGPALPAYVSQYFPADGATGVGGADFGLVIKDGATTVIPGGVQVFINGTQVATVLQSSGGSTQVGLVSPMPPGSNTVQLVYSTSGGGPYSSTWSFVVNPYVTLSTNLWTPPGSGSNPGFAMKVYQAPNTNIFNGWQDEARMADMALQGLYEANVADLTQQTNNGEMWWPGVINFAQNNTGAQNDNGNFTTANGYQDSAVPGLAAWDPTTIGSTAAKMDNSAFEAKVFLEFPAAGAYVMGVNSDDGFRVTVGDRGAPGTSPLYILAPASEAGQMTSEYTTTADEGGNNGFGVNPPETVPLIGRAVLVDPPNGNNGAINNGAALKGNIAVIYRGPNFQTQCRWCAANGAIAVIGGTLTTDVTLPGTRGAAGNGTDPAIPCLQVGYPDFRKLTNSITTTSNSPVIVRITMQDCSPIVGKYDGPRGASDTVFTVQVPQAGIYPFRLVWVNGGGDANCEWFTMDPITRAKILVNDTTNPKAIKAWISRNVNASGALPAPKLLPPTVSGGNVMMSWTGQGELWESYSLNGPWFKSTYQANPSVVATTPFLTERFFRVRQY